MTSSSKSSSANQTGPKKLPSFNSQHIRDCNLSELELPDADNLSSLAPVYRAHSTILGWIYDLIAKEDETTFLARVITEFTGESGEYGSVSHQELKGVPGLIIMKYKKSFE
jgi:hypothetical protein